MIINAEISDNFLDLPKDEAQDFINDLLKEIKMKPLGNLNWADAEDLDFPGQSFVQMITTSHCSLHLFTDIDNTNQIYFDLYSCKKFDPEKVISILDKKFQIKKFNGIIYTRAIGTKPKVENISG
jgi:S-adenosylmethionine/arginine decarboxylase-like enzyme